MEGREGRRKWEVREEKEEDKGIIGEGDEVSDENKSCDQKGKAGRMEKKGRELGKAVKRRGKRAKGES